MANKEGSEVEATARWSTHERQESHIAQLVEQFMAEVNRLADEDWKKSDGWVAQLILLGNEGKQTYVYELKDGKLGCSESEGPFVATITMTVDTFVELIYAALLGKTDLASERKYAARHIVYEGERRTIDSEQLRKVFQRLGTGAKARE